MVLSTVITAPIIKNVVGLLAMLTSSPVLPEQTEVRLAVDKLSQTVIPRLT